MRHAGRGTAAGPGARARVVIVGAGFAGLHAARALRRADADVTIVDGHDYHTFQPLLYQVSTGYLAPEEVGTAPRWSSAGRRTCACGSGRRPGWTTRLMRCAAGGSRLDFDYLIVAAGADANFFGIPGVRDHAWPLYTLPDAIRLRRHLLSTLEQAAARHDAGPINVFVGRGPPPASRRRSAHLDGP